MKEEETQILRIGLDGRWEASEFATSLTALDRLYTLRFGLAIEEDELRDLRDFYREGPFLRFHSSTRYLRRWANLAAPKLLHAERTPLVSAAQITAAAELLEPGERLVVQRVIYGSPGIKDLAGVGEIVGHVKDLLVRLIDHWSTQRQRDLENVRRELENQTLEIEIAKQFVGLAQGLGYSKREMRQLVSIAIQEQRPLVRLIATGKITSADTVNEAQE
jgi:HAMP domain-containing protein